MRKILSILLLIGSSFIVVKCGAQTVYTLVTSTADLTAGSKYIIASSQSGVTSVMGYQNTSNRPQATTSFTVTSNTITATPATAAGDVASAYEITLGGTSGAWTLYDAATNIYLQATSSSSNVLKSGSGTWTISFSSNAAVITCTNGGSHNLLRYNPTAFLFSCYTSGQSSIYLYKEVPAATNTLATDYFRSRQNGNWGDVSTWQSSHDGSTNWVTADLAPGASAADVLVSHTVAITTSTTVNHARVAATLLLLNGTINTTVNGNTYNGTYNGVLNLYDGGATDELTILNAGKLQAISSAAIYTAAVAYNSSGNINVNTGGTISIGDGAGTHTASGFSGFGTEPGTHVTWNNYSVFDWNTTATTSLATSSATYFPAVNATTIPILRVSTTMGGTWGASTATVIYGRLEINAPNTLTGSGSKTIRDGLQGSSVLTLTSAGTNLISSGSAILDGSLTIKLNVPLNISGITVPSGANIKIDNTSTNNIQLGGNNFYVDAGGTFDIGTTSTLSGSGTVTVYGTFKTGNAGGFSGTSSSIPTATATINSGSTIEYNAAGNQAVTARSDYYNLTFSGSGTKTPGNAITPTGTVYITGSATLDATAHNIGDGSTSGPTVTNLKMDGGVLLLGTTGTQPQMAGTYNLTAGIVRFAGGSSQTIRSKAYQNIEVTGTGVGNSSGNITLNSAGTFKVKTGGIFTINDNTITCPSGNGAVTVESGATIKTGNTKGFSGFAATFADNSAVHSNITNITLANGSTIEYTGGTAGTTNQEFSSRSDYSNVVLSGATASRKIMNGNSTVGGSLTLNNGVLVTSNYLLTWNNSGGILKQPTTYTDSYICTCDATGKETTVKDGTAGFRINNVSGSSDVVFPVGSDFISPNRMAINMNGSTADDFTVVVGKGDIANTPWPKINRIWYVKEANAGGSTATMKLYFTERDASQFLIGQDEVENGFDYSKITLVQKDILANTNFVNASAGTDIQNFPNGTYNNKEVYALYTLGVSPDVSNNTNGIENFHYFSVVSNATNIILPATVTGIKAYQKGNSVQVDWTALNETNVDHYTIERSANAVDFSNIATINAHNSGNPRTDYTSTDNHPVNGKNYYRIKISDKDGRSATTITVLVTIENGKAFIAVVPNPVQHKNINLSFNNVAGGQYNIVLYSLTGQRVYAQTFEYSGGTNIEKITLPAGTTSGAYVLKVFNSSHAYTVRVLVE